MQMQESRKGDSEGVQATSQDNYSSLIRINDTKVQLQRDLSFQSYE